MHPLLIADSNQSKESPNRADDSTGLQRPRQCNSQKSLILQRCLRCNNLLIKNAFIALSGKMTDPRASWRGHLALVPYRRQDAGGTQGRDGLATCEFPKAPECSI
jgi:hypothetical protein